MLAESPTAKRQAEEERRLRIIDEFRTAAFEDLVAKAEQQVILKYLLLLFLFN